MVSALIICCITLRCRASLGIALDVVGWAAPFVVVRGDLHCIGWVASTNIGSVLSNALGIGWILGINGTPLEVFFEGHAGATLGSPSGCALQLGSLAA
jgi:hypothetical protein